MNKKLLLIFGMIFIIMAIVIGFLITQTSPIITKVAQVTIEVKPRPDFTFTLDPETQWTFVGRTVPIGVTVTSVNDFAGVIEIDATVPDGWTFIFPIGHSSITLGAGETKGIQIDITIPDDENHVGIHTISVIAESSIYN